LSAPDKELETRMNDFSTTNHSDNIDSLWQTIRVEVARVIEQEPVLDDYFTNAIMNYPTLETALIGRIARQLASTTLSADPVEGVFSEAMANDPDISDRMRRDLRAYFDRDPACDHYHMPLMYFKGFHALQAHRIAHWLWSQDRHALALFIQNRVSEVYGVDIHPGAQIGGGIMIDHATGLVIGETAVVGDNVSMLHSVTLGGTGHETGDRHPKIGCGVLISAGAKILGNIHVGEGAKVGAGSLVLREVKPHTTVAGVPATVVGRPKVDQPALDMDQGLGETND